MSSLKDEVRKVLRGEVEDTAETLEKYSRDASLFKVTPALVVYPKDADDVATLVRFVLRKKQTPKTHISITARAAGTDMSGGPLNDSIILDTTKHLNHFLELNKRPLGNEAGYAVVEPGMYFRDFDKHTKTQDLELPSYTASRELCTVGGMAANNSGGEKNLKYGKTARYVKELEVVLADGHKHTLRNYAGDAFAHKIKEDSFEGELMRKVATLISTPAHRKVIEEHRPHVEKNSSGYALWDIGDGKTSLNLARSWWVRKARWG
jgi:FAD/FMN-containing dehydrogenase